MPLASRNEVLPRKDECWTVGITGCYCCGDWLNRWVLVELTSPACLMSPLSVRLPRIFRRAFNPLCLLFSFKVVEDTLSCAEEGVSLAKRRTFFARVGTQFPLRALPSSVLGPKVKTLAARGRRPGPCPDL